MMRLAVYRVILRLKIKMDGKRALGYSLPS
jgi:hypothetical protein